MTQNTEVILAKTIAAQPVAGDLELVDRPIPEAADGQILVRVIAQSLDPYIGSTLRSKHMGEKAPGPGDSLPGFCVGEVIGSKHADIVVGEYVVGECGWTQFGVMKGDAVRKVDPSVALSAHLGILGMPGLTAWAGVTQLAKVGPGDVFLADAAAGAVGGTAGQIAKKLGARAVGVAGGAEKCALVTDTYGFDACVNYRAEGWVEALKTATEGGPTVHFENVGLSVLLPVMQMLKLNGRVILCGLAEHYQQDGPPPQMPVGIIVGKRARMLGLVVYDYYAKWAEWVALARPWMEDGSLVFAEDAVDGLEHAAEQFERLMQGKNKGKSIVRVGPDKA
jgi:NADPH-dependent curcumin reductase CurA